MRSKILITALTIALSVATPIVGSIAFPEGAIAQTVDQRKVEAGALRASEANRLFEQGNKLLEQNQNEGAIASFQKALTIYRELKKRQKEGQTLKAIGNVYSALQQPEKSIDYQQQALAIALEIKDQDLQARALSNIGLSYQDLKKLEQAIAYFKQSLAVTRSSQNFKMRLWPREVWDSL